MPAPGRDTDAVALDLRFIGVQRHEVDVAVLPPETDDRARPVTRAIAAGFPTRRTLIEREGRAAIILMKADIRAIGLAHV